MNAEERKAAKDAKLAAAGSTAPVASAAAPETPAAPAPTPVAPEAPVATPAVAQPTAAPAVDVQAALSPADLPKGVKAVNVYKVGKDGGETFVRTFSSHPDEHGKDFKATADKFAEKRRGMGETIVIKPAE